MKINKTEIPQNSLLYPNNKQYNYIDSYEGAINDETNKISIIDVVKAFLKPGPKWIDSLFMLRNKIVSLFGLKTPNEKVDTKQQNDLKFESGERVGLFKVFNRIDNEIILGEDDKHLNFRVSLLLSEQKNNKSNKNITITTIVIYNNWFGRLYFFPLNHFTNL